MDTLKKAFFKLIQLTKWEIFFGHETFFLKIPEDSDSDFES